MNSKSTNEAVRMSPMTPTGDRRLPGEIPQELRQIRRFAPDKAALADAIQVVRALDADSYQALLWALGLMPDPRLAWPGRAQLRRTQAGAPAATHA